MGAVANLTYLDNRYLDNVLCVNGTQRRLFRTISDVPDYAEESNITLMPPSVNRNFTLGITIAYGPLHAFPSSVETDRIAISDQGFRVEKISIVWPDGEDQDDDMFKCFTENQLNPMYNISSVLLPVICQNTSHTAVDGIVDFLVVGTNAFDFGTNTTTLAPSHRQSTSTQDVSSVQFATATLNVSSMFLISRVEFPQHEEPLFTAADIVNIDFFTGLPLIPSDFEASVHRLMYVKYDNLSVSARRDKVETVTVLDTVFVVVAAAEVAFVILFAVLMVVVGSVKQSVVKSPTTLDGLSQCWARDTGRRQGGKYVCLKMTGDKNSGNGHYLTCVH